MLPLEFVKNVTIREQIFLMINITKYLKYNSAKKLNVSKSECWKKLNFD